MCLTHFGKRLPDSLQSISRTEKVVSFLQADLMDMEAGKYSVKCFLTYSDSVVKALGIQENNLTKLWQILDRRM
jgi:hypothetical protein